MKTKEKAQLIDEKDIKLAELFESVRRFLSKKQKKTFCLI